MYHVVMLDIIMTIGPVSERPDTIELMLEVATRFRINIAHLDSQHLQRILSSLEEHYRAFGRITPVVIDLQGAKIRIGKYPRVTEIPSVVDLVLAGISNDATVIPVPHESVFLMTQIGDTICLNDGKVVLKIIDKIGPVRMRAECMQNGELGSAKGLNSVDHVFALARMTEVDSEAVKIGNEYPFVEYAVSFVGDGSEAGFFRPFTGHHRLIAKIERRVAMENLINIDDNFDELWLCRGDLGAEVGWRDLGVLQNTFVKAFPLLHRPKILAGEVLGSMVSSPLPSRSEMVHLYDILQSGFDGIVLSDETACGVHLSDVIRFLREYLRIS